METVSLDSSAAQVRPSRLVAEALVLRHGCAEVKRRAQSLGFNERLTFAVVSVCCRNITSGDNHSTEEAQS